MPGFTGRGTTGLTPILTDEKLVVFDVSLFCCNKPSEWDGVPGRKCEGFV